MWDSERVELGKAQLERALPGEGLRAGMPVGEDTAKEVNVRICDANVGVFEVAVVRGGFLGHEFGNVVYRGGLGFVDEMEKVAVVPCSIYT